MAGIDKEVGYRFLRNRYLELRRSGLSADDAAEVLGFRSRRVSNWEAAHKHDQGGRHHLRVDASREGAFWEAFDDGADADTRRTRRLSRVRRDIGGCTAASSSSAGTA